MTIGPRSQCSVCTRFQSPFDHPGRTEAFCAAFPEGIPDQVYNNTLDHRQPVDGDHGIRWESDGRPYPQIDVPSDGDSDGEPSATRSYEPLLKREVFRPDWLDGEPGSQ